MQTGDTSLADANFEQLVNNSMYRFIDPSSQLVNFTASFIPNAKGKCLFGGAVCNSPMCHDDTAMFPEGLGGVRCDNIDWLPKFRAGYKFTPTSSIVNAFAVRSMTMLAELANATNRSYWANRLQNQASRTKAGMLAQMYHNESGMWCDGICTATANHSTFHSQHFLLSLGLTPESGVGSALTYLRGEGMVGSTYSANSLVRGLFERGGALDYGQAALDLLTSCSEHSWCRMLNAGATTTWEHWEPHDGTHSHVWSATPAANIASGLMGIRPTAPGWEEWILRPAPGDLSTANITVPTPRGAISVNYTRGHQSVSEHLDVRISVLLLSNSTASLCVPLFGVDPGEARLSLDGVAISGREEAGGAYLCVDGVSRPTSNARLEIAVKSI